MAKITNKFRAAFPILQTIEPISRRFIVPNPVKTAFYVLRSKRNHNNRRYSAIRLRKNINSIMKKNRLDRVSLKYKLMAIYHALHQSFGPRNWWPGDSDFEVIVGAILTQNTSWKNVEKAIRKLKDENLLTPAALYQVDISFLADTIKSSGFYQLKAKRLKNFIEFMFRDYRGEMEVLSSEESGVLRKKLLKVNGIGPETADSILLYALGKPIFVVDAYTRRIFSRHDLINESYGYSEIQQLFMDNLPHDMQLYNEYHALIVCLGNSICKKKPLCDRCPLKDLNSHNSFLIPNSSSIAIQRKDVKNGS